MPWNLNGSLIGIIDQGLSKGPENCEGQRERQEREGEETDFTRHYALSTRHTKTWRVASTTEEINFDCFPSEFWILAPDSFLHASLSLLSFAHYVPTMNDYE